MDKEQVYTNYINCLDNMIKHSQYTGYVSFKYGLQVCETQYRKEKLEAKVKHLKTRNGS